MKKVLVVNTKCKVFGGEDANIGEEIKFLEKNYIVEYLEFDNSKSLNVFDILGFLFLSNHNSNQLFKKTIHEFKPDFVYIHNTWFMANLGIFKILKKLNIRTFIKIHNFRFICTSTFFAKKHLKLGEFCPMCGMKKSRSLVFNKYFENSLPKSIFANYFGIRYLRILKNYPVELIVLNNFFKEQLIVSGFDKDKVNILYNPLYIDFKNNYEPNSDYVVYAGQLSFEKGLYELIQAWIKSNTVLKLFLIGDNKLVDKNLNITTSSNIYFLGQKENDDVIKYIKNARAVITATKMFEGQPRLLTEASTLAIPSIYPSYGGMDEYFPKDYQYSFTQFKEEELIEKIKLLDNLELLKKESKRNLEHINVLLDKNNMNDTFKKIVNRNA